MKRRKSSLGCLFWIALILLFIVIFLFNKGRIESVLENTGFWDKIGRDGSPPEVERVEEPPVTPGRGTETPAVPPAPAPAPPAAPSPPPRPAETPPETVVEVLVPEETAPREEPPAQAPPADTRVRRSRLYFVNVDPQGGTITLEGVIRPIHYKDSPLTETLNSLLKGLSTSELNEGLLSLIPEGTKLNSASVRDGIAYLDFSDDFLFNSFGMEGYAAQLQQVVYTAMEFTNVRGVQILINGKRQEYMSIEGGIYIGQPLSKKDF